MSRGNAHTDHLMAPLGFGKLKPEVYNRIYEAVDVLSEHVAENLVKAVGAALFAERERCAKVARSVHGNRPSCWEGLSGSAWMEGYNRAKKDIAAAIRRGEETKDG